MNNETYNGWTNYATWRINLEMIDSDYWMDTIEAEFDEEELQDKDEVVYKLSRELQRDIEEYLEEQGQEVTLDYALAFVSDVNWYEIAEHIYNDYKGV